MYHTSPDKIEHGSINKYGVFDDCLFFSDNIYVMTQSDKYYVYQAEFNCIDARNLYDESIVIEIAERFNVDNDTAEKLLDGRANEWHYGAESEDSYWLQATRGECAVKMGYDGCEDVDEQGTVYIVPMYGREHELTLIDIESQ